MDNNIFFFQTTSLGGANGQIGIFNLFKSHLDGLDQVGLFEEIKVVVPNQAMSVWVKDQIALADGICANLDCVVLLGPVLENIYLANQSNQQMFDFSQAKFIIYEFLTSDSLFELGAREITDYIIQNGKVDKLRAYQLASQLQQIFDEYLYLRTDELINLKSSKFPIWQQKILVYLFDHTKGQKTFLDIYRYFAELDLETNSLKLPKNLFIFGLTSVYPSQLQIIKKLAQKINIYWYYQPSSSEYYGDLLSSKAKAKLEKRLLRKPELSLDDLFLTDGNPLLANLGQQSREFIELLNANDIQVYSFNSQKAEGNHTNPTYLNIIQKDIRQLTYRVAAEYRLGNDPRYYADPIQLNHSESMLFDLEEDLTSIKINICHNRMREVQVVFNEIVALLNQNPQLGLDQILITAPDIDKYASYISAVFDNESVRSESSEKLHILYNITGNRSYKSYRAIETIKFLLNAPYHLTTNYLLEILLQTEIQLNLNISVNDIELVRKWLQDNYTYWGYDKDDFGQFGYDNFSVHTFKRFLSNLVLGGCLNEPILTKVNNLPVYKIENDIYIPYDNLDSAQLELCNKLIILIELLERVRSLFYVDENIYKELPLSQVLALLTELRDTVILNDESVLEYDKFLGSVSSIGITQAVTLPIINLLIDDYINSFKTRIRFNGKVTCASMRYMRNIPFEHIFIMGLNFGEFPTSYNQNRLSILSKDWYIADRNYNIEDKQTFLDIILSAGKRLVLSYVGRKETDNSSIKPSPILELFLTTLGQSFIDFKVASSGASLEFDFKNLLTQQSLHPFYNNRQANFSVLWYQVSNACNILNPILRWDFSRTSRINLTENQQKKFYQLNIDQLLKTFVYTNYNLYRVLELRTFNNEEVELTECENLQLFDNKIAKEIYSCLEKYTANADRPSDEELREYLQLRGILGYQHIGETQFRYYSQLYQTYVLHRGTDRRQLLCEYTIKRGEDEIKLTIKDQVWIENNALIIIDRFDQIKKQSLANKLGEVSYELRFKALILLAMLSNKQQICIEGHQINQVIVRQLSVNGDKRDFMVYLSCNQKNLFENILKYYLRSLANPVLVHRAAISAYAKSYASIEHASPNSNDLAKCLNKAQEVYLEDYKNFDLERIKDDMIFGSIAKEYFEFIDKNSGVNDIVMFGKFLSDLKG